LKRKGRNQESRSVIPSILSHSFYSQSFLLFSVIPSILSHSFYSQSFFLSQSFPQLDPPVGDHLLLFPSSSPRRLPLFRSAVPAAPSLPVAPLRLQCARSRPADQARWRPHLLEAEPQSPGVRKSVARSASLARITTAIPTGARTSKPPASSLIGPCNPSLKPSLCPTAALQLPRIPSTTGILLRRAAPLLHRGPAAPVHPSSGQGLQQLRRPARKLPEASTLYPKPCPRRNRARGPPPISCSALRFLAAGDPRTSLTPVGPLQDLHESIHGDQKHGGPCIIFLRERRPSPPLGPRRRPPDAVSPASSSPR
jgi:hypothetical protein